MKAYFQYLSEKVFTNCLAGQVQNKYKKVGENKKGLEQTFPWSNEAGFNKIVK